MKSIVVKKFGGAGLADIKKIKQVANHLRSISNHNQQVIAVVSAMGSTTDELIKKAYEISQHPDRRELDMLVSTGERMSMSLLTMALKELNCDAISFTGSQAGIMTDDSHSMARIVDIRPFRVQEAIEKGKIVVVAGFQGVNPETKEITTLGRGGTDTTAIALANYFKAEQCEIIKEVDGIYTADPNRVPNAKKISSVSLSGLLQLTKWGLRALDTRCVEMAQTSGTPLWVGSLEHLQDGTLCTESGESRGLAILDNVFYLKGRDSFTCIKEFFGDVSWPHPRLIEKFDNHWFFSSDLPTYESTKFLAQQKGHTISHYPLSSLCILPPLPTTSSLELLDSLDLKFTDSEKSCFIFTKPIPNKTIQQIHSTIY